MLALYRSGRQADALRAYQQARRTLVDEIGLEPSRELQALEQAILVQDPSLDSPTPTPAAALVAAPAGAHQGVRPVPPVAERKVVSVLIADLSTEFGGEEDPERTRVLLERSYHATAQEIRTVGGTAEQLVGGAVMAVFGTPLAQEDHADRALHTALVVQRTLRELLGDQLVLRVGVSSGEVIAGETGAGGPLVSGEAVTTAAWLAQAAAPGEIVVDQRTAAAARGGFQFSDPDTIQPTGRPRGVVCRRLLGALARRPPDTGGLGRTFVGRDVELELLRATSRRVAQEAQPHLVTVIGEAGVGKTTAVGAFCRWLEEREPRPLLRSGRCLAYGHGITYWPLAEVLREHFGLSLGDPAEVVLERLGQHAILGLTLGLDVAGDLHPLAARDQLHEAWVALTEELAAQEPTVLLVEDLHWAEGPLLDLLERLVHDVRGPLLLLATARPELLDRRPGWSTGQRNAATLWLEPLPAAEAIAMVQQVLDGTPPAAVERLVVDRAEGNPFFVEELLATLVDQGVLYRRDGAWECRPVTASASVPDSVRAVLAARIDLLPQRAKEALQAAAIAGRVFSTAAVQELLGAATSFDTLVDRDFIRRSPRSSVTDERAFGFKHALTREVAYASITKARRARLHAAFAARLERVGQGGDEHAPLLAHHYAEAVRPQDADLAWAEDEQELRRLRERARLWLRRAGELALGRYAIGEGLGLLRRALELDPAAEEQAELWQLLGRGHALRYDGGPTLDAFRRAAELTSSGERQGEIYAELAFETVMRYGMLNPMPARGLVEDWIDRALELARAGSAPLARALVARAFWYPTSEEAVANAVALSDQLGDVVLRSQAYGARVVSAFVADRYQESQQWADRRLALADRISDPDHLVDIYSMVIPGLLGQGRFDQARRYADLHDQAASKLSTHHQVHAVAMKLELEELAGRWDAIAALQLRTQQVVQGNVATPCVRNARSLLSCAVADAYLGEEERSRALEDRANELVMEGFGTSMAAVRLRLALLRRELDMVERLVAEGGLPPPAKNWWRLNTLAARLDALAVLGDRRRGEQEAPPLVVPNTYLGPFALRTLGMLRQDDRLVGRAAEAFAALGLAWHAECTRALLTGTATLL
jgi:class 3 adenylate cyclase